MYLPNQNAAYHLFTNIMSHVCIVYDFPIFLNNIFFVFLFAGDKTPSGFPVITQSPQTRVIEIGHTAVMQCRSTGNPTPKIYWLKDGKRLEMNQRYTLIDGKQLSFVHSFYMDSIFHPVILQWLTSNMLLLTTINWDSLILFGVTYILVVLLKWRLINNSMVINLCDVIYFWLNL